MSRALVWLAVGIGLAVLALGFLPVEVLGNLVPMLVIVVIGVGLTVVAGLRGRRADELAEASRLLSDRTDGANPRGDRPDDEDLT